MSVAAALELFANVPRIRKILQTLYDVGLGYIPLGQAAPTLSGGEAQRVKLAAELARPDTGKTLYILDEPTTGLHFDDVRKLLDVIHRLADLGNTVVVIEHNLEVIKTADWVIDLGPEAGVGGGDLVAEGTPEAIVKNQRSHTGKFLKPVLDGRPAGRAAQVQPQERSRNERKTEKEQWQGRRRQTERPRKTAKGSQAESPRQVESGIVAIRNLESGNLRARPRPPGRSTAGSGTPATASPGTAGRRGGMAASWNGSSTGSRPWPHPSSDAIDSGFAPTDWSQRNVVRINGSDTAKISFPFFHATTSSEWVVTLRFFVPKNTFRGRSLENSSIWCRFTRVRRPCSATCRG